MINTILKKYKAYDLVYNPAAKILFIRKPIPVRDFVVIRKIIEINKLDVKNIAVCRW